MAQTMTELGIMAALDVARSERRYLYPVTFNDEAGAWLPHDFGGEDDDAFPVSRSRKQIELWASLYPDDMFAVLPRSMEDLYGADREETFEDPAAHQAALDDAEYRRVKARLNAERRLASESYQGTFEVAWLDFLNQSETAWLVEGFIGERTTTFLVARGNTGKTFAYLDMALCMATGREWHGAQTKPGKTMLVIGEGFSGFPGRVRAWCERHDVDPATLADSFVVFDGANLNNDESLEVLGARVESFQPDLIVFDTWAQTSGISDEDKSALSSRTLNAVKGIAPSASVLYVTHPTKASEDTKRPILRGSGALFGAADTVITMYADTDYTTGLDRKYLAVSTETEHGGKSRDAEQVTLRGFYLDDEGASKVLVRDDSEGLSKSDRYVFECLAEHMPLDEALTLKEIADASGRAESTLERHLKGSKAVERVPDGKRFKYKRVADKAPRRISVDDHALRAMEE